MLKRQTSILLFSFVFTQFILGNVNAVWPEDAVVETECDNAKPICNGSKNFSSVDGEITYKFECRSKVEAITLKESAQEKTPSLPELPITPSTDNFGNLPTSDTEDKEECTSSKISCLEDDKVTKNKIAKPFISHSLPSLPDEPRRPRSVSDAGRTQQLLIRNESFTTWLKSKAIAEGFYHAATGELLMKFMVKCKFLCDNKNIRLDSINVKSKSNSDEWHITDWYSICVAPNQYLIIAKFNSWHGDGTKFGKNFESIDNVSVSIECNSRGDIKFYTLDENFFKIN